MQLDCLERAYSAEMTGIRGKATRLESDLQLTKARLHDLDMKSRYNEQFAYFS